MGQCSSSVRQWTRHPPPSHHDEPPQHEQANAPASSSTIDAPTLRRRRSTDGMRHQFKRQRPHDDTDTDREVSPELFEENVSSQRSHDFPAHRRASASLAPTPRVPSGTAAAPRATPPSTARAAASAAAHSASTAHSAAASTAVSAAASTAASTASLTAPATSVPSAAPTTASTAASVALSAAPSTVPTTVSPATASTDTAALSTASTAPQPRSVPDASQEFDSVSSVSASEGSGRSSPSELTRRSRTLRRLRDSLASPFIRRPSGSSVASISRPQTPSTMDGAEGSEETRSLDYQTRDSRPYGERPELSPARSPERSPTQASAENPTPDTSSSTRSVDSRDDSEFFDASAYISPPQYERDGLQDRRPDRPLNYPPPLPRTRPPPPPLPLVPHMGPHRSRREDENEQITLLSRVLLAAATLTATHLVGEHISRGELYGGSNEISRMRQRAQQEMNTLMDEARPTNGAQRTDPERTPEAGRPSQQEQQPSTGSQDSRQDTGQDTLQNSAQGIQPDTPHNDQQNEQHNEQQNEQQNEHSEQRRDSRRRSQELAGGQQSDRPMLSFPDFLEQLRTGRHSTELSRVMFDSSQASNFFRFFRFPEDHEGRIPILLMGIRSAEHARRPDDETDSPNEPEGRRHSTGSRNAFGLDEEQSAGFEERPRDSLRSRDQDDWNNVNELDPQLRGLDPHFLDDAFGLHRAESDDNESEEEMIEEYAAYVRNQREQAHNSSYGAAHDLHEDFGHASVHGDSDRGAHDEDDDTHSNDNEQIFFEDNDDLIPESNPSDLFMGAMLEGLVSGPFSRTGREDRQFNRAHLRHDDRGSDFGDDDDGVFNINAHPFAPRPRAARPAGAEPRTEAGPTQGAGRRRSHQSWVIYVIGGAYPPTHPIFFAPSLLTDNPTYEDMMIFEQLLGPVKPAVATKNDVAAAGGEFTVTADSPLLTDRCPICLMDYAEDDNCRELNCKHIFHQECVDSWLTRSHNSCPMCRHEGVPANNRPQASQGAGFGTA